MNRPPELLKPFANHLAQLASSDDRSHLLRLLQLTGLFAGPACACAQPEADSRQPARASDRIGIWERKSKDGKSYFARSLERANEWNMWANEGRIETKGAKRRIVLIGESVARGYLYDPLFTPAKVLEQILKPYFPETGVEVIDLARLSLLQDQLLELAESALVLEPDAVVIFAGNNWGLGFSASVNDPDYRRSVSTVARQAGVAGLKRFAEERLQREIQNLVEAVASLYQSRGIPFFWIVPEFNLGDWRDPETNAPYLQAGANRDWLALWQQSRQALQNGDTAAARATAEKMVELDQGVCVAGLYLLAECSRRAGDRQAERHHLERARDALIWDNTGYVPSRSYTVVQETLREEAGKRGSEIVDLPLAFNEYLKGELPDRRLFVDHCHLTSDGIRLAMSATAARLLQRLTGAAPHWSALADRRIAPPADVEAEAAFLAAVHNAHWWQSGDLVDHFCQRAVDHSPKVAQMITTFSELQTRRPPMLMSRSAEQFAKLGAGLIQFYTVQYSKHLLDEVFLNAIERAARRLGVDRGRLEKLQQQEHSVARKDNNLLDYYYCSAARQPRELMWAFAVQGLSPLLRMRSDYYKAYGQTSRFIFVGESDCPVGLRLTCRLPRGGRAEGDIAVEVNGTPLGELAVTRDWQSWQITVGEALVRDGLNEVVIHWPLPEFPEGQQLDATFEHLVDEGTYPDFYPVFGEIHAFVAADARKARAGAAA
ncbi:MAG TPA: hypothetical protein VJ464_02820 [Blastocatellia bacterium]|nr:hypothetical protein [Blastocatellia bacterium]